MIVILTFCLTLSSLKGCFLFINIFIVWIVALFFNVLFSWSLILTANHFVFILLLFDHLYVIFIILLFFLLEETFFMKIAAFEVNYCWEKIYKEKT